MEKQAKKDLLFKNGTPKRSITTFDRPSYPEDKLNTADPTIESLFEFDPHASTILSTEKNDYTKGFNLRGRNIDNVDSEDEFLKEENVGHLYFEKPQMDEDPMDEYAEEYDSEEEDDMWKEDEDE